MRERRHARASAVALLLAGAMTGCGPSDPPRTAYILDAGPPARATQSSDLGKPVVEVRQALLPDYLDTTDIVTRKTDGSLVASRTGRWGERMSLLVTDALARSLAARLPDVAVATSRPDGTSWRQILVDVDTFGLGPNGTCVLTAAWTVRAAHGDVIDKQRATFVEPVAAPNDATLVATMSREADALAASIATSLRPHQPNTAGVEAQPIPRPRARGNPAERRDSVAEQ